MADTPFTELTPTEAVPNTDYDTLWKAFLANCKVEDVSLPTTEYLIKEAIRNAVMHFNNRLRKGAVADSIEETITVEGNKLSDDDTLILAHYLRYFFLLNEQTYVQHMWQPFQKDIGLKNMATQIASMKDTIQIEKDTIEKLIFNAEEDFL